MTGTPVQFTQIQSFVSPSFWHKLSEIKVEEDHLSDAPKPIKGFYTNRCSNTCSIEMDHNSFNTATITPRFIYRATGTLHNKNTVEDFKECDKNLLMQEEGKKLVEDFDNGRILDDPSSLARFYILTFADIKCYNYYYWFGFPCPLTPPIILQSEVQKVENIGEFHAFTTAIKQSINHGKQPDLMNFFVLKSYRNSARVYSLKEIILADDFLKELSSYYFCFADSSPFASPSWVMRVYVIFLFHKCPYLIGKSVNFLGLRYDDCFDIGQSLIWEVTMLEKMNLDQVDRVKMVGWEPNRNSKLAPRMVSMRNNLDPAKLAESSVNLNLKLMKWRLLPEINLNLIVNTKCLVFGAGTLGCAVARSLLGWGFKYISFIDSGRVGYSNPVRQSLYVHADAISGNEMKAEVAAKRIKEINPCVVSSGHVIQIPMPGHPVGESLMEETCNNLDQLIQLINDVDVIFLLTDSRESRWLPTLLGAAHKKIVINAALGFESYLVMRHGGNKTEEADFSDIVDLGDLKCLHGTQLGCYFCNDVTAPGNSTKDRTLDQQCTVTRPGVSNIAASYAVELLVAILQHSDFESAPAYYTLSGKSETKVPEGILGILPHSIRGMLSNFENILPATKRFTQCIACSDIVISEYKRDGKAFLLKAIQSAKYLEDLTGISNFNNLDNDIIDFDLDLDSDISDD